MEIDATLAPGVLNYGELTIPGESDEEIFLSTYVCHPSMANNELSGPMVTTWLAKHILERRRRYSYRIVFIPETIGSLVYLSRNLDAMRAKIVAGFNITCIGDERAYGHVPSRAGDTLADRAARHVLQHTDPDYRQYSYLDRGSDERQYCAPGVDLPVTTITRSKYHEYPEYHTSLDDLDFVTPAGLQGGYDALRRSIDIIEANRTWRMTVLGEPQLGKRGLYPDISTVHDVHPAKTLMDFLAYCDGEHDLIAIAETIGVPAWELIPHARKMAEHGLIEADLLIAAAMTREQARSDWIDGLGADYDHFKTFVEAALAIHNDAIHVLARVRHLRGAGAGDASAAGQLDGAGSGADPRSGQ